MTPPDAVIELVERFERNYADYIKPTYLEEQARFEFINPFFKALGWDMDNTQGYAEAYKDVLYESALKVGGSTKAPDYSFGIGPTRKFFLEAKRPGTNIETDLDAPYQLRTYAYTAQFPLSVLTNFRHLAVYDGKVQPARKDSPAIARLKFYSFQDYLEKWDEIAGLLARDSILKGAFDKFAAEKTRRGTASFDVAFLREIEGWREALAKHIAAENNLTSDELNFAVGRIIDRIIFLRICEERGIEQSLPLAALKGGGPKLYERLVELFRKADARYNSGLFHFDAGDKLHEAPDELTPHLKIGTKPLVDILQHLYYPHTSYAYDRIPLEILGQIYERFLGKVITLKGKTATVDEKPEVRKAGGVYYTPSYIVDYIVAQTVGKLLDGRTPQSAAKLKILDPACGSGSFLLGAYAYLLDWHLNWYAANDPTSYAKRRNPPIYAAAASDPTVKGTSWRLTSSERKRILRDNIFGVDIDRQAVEVTKLSLLLKVLEGETDESISNTLKLFHERALPDLGDNIKCGNSLIGPDFYDAHPPGSLSEAEEKRLNVFDWHREFAAIMKSGGFDAVIGNPPYGFHQIHTALIKKYFKAGFSSSSGSYEHYFLFYEASLRHLRNGGIHGFIVPVTWLTIPSAAGLRQFILSKFALREICWLPELVFKNAQVNTLVSIIEHTKPGKTRVLISEVNDPAQNKGIQKEIEQFSFVDSGYVIHIFDAPQDTALLKKIEAQSVPLSAFARPCSGYNPYEVGKGHNLAGQPHDLATVNERPYHSTIKHDESWKPEAMGRSLNRYSLEWPHDRFVKYGLWLAAPRDSENFIGPRLLVQEIVGGSERRIIATYCEQELYYSRDIIPIKFDQLNHSPLFFLGIINSRFITWIHHRRSPKAKKQLFPKVLVSDLKNLPVPKIDLLNKNDKARHDRMVQLVEAMLKLQQDVKAARLGDARERLQRRIEATDKQIDALVCELYGLTADEIALVEG